MRSLPHSAKIYLIIVWMCAAFIIIQALWAFTENYEQLVLLAAGVIGYIIADFFEVAFGGENEKKVVMTVTDAPAVFFVAVSGLCGVLIVALGSLIADAFHKRPWYRAAFNSASQTLTYSAVLAVFTALQPKDTLPFAHIQGLLTLIAVALTYYICNTILISTVVALASSQPLYKVYRTSFQSVSWINFMTFPLGALLAALWFVDGALMVMAALVLIVAQRAFAAVAGWQAESLRNAALAEEQTQLYQQLRQQHEALIQAEKLSALGTFAASLAHEFGNLISATLGHAQLALLSKTIADKDSALKIIERTSQHGRSITASLRTFARRNDFVRRVQLVETAIEDTLKIVEHKLASENIEVVLNIDPVSPTLCDISGLVQVLLNLVTNAMDAMRPYGSGTLTIELTEQDDHLELVVQDTGTGISENVRASLFEPFVTTKESGKGTGLGLAVCYGIVKDHGGTITVTSTAGVGTIFTVSLPIVAQESSGQFLQREMA